ncbi:MAG: histidine phosphatase family protein, partial [Planctomycetes bacterium]|nr:histidine phosphatase family protein [Planctomycetota bacterium]
MVNVIVIRPGCTDYDEQQRIQGSLDLPLNSRGREQVDHLAEQLADTEIEVLFTAPGEPARSTAAAIGESLGITVKEKKGLRNLDQGLWE